MHEFQQDDDGGQDDIRPFDIRPADSIEQRTGHGLRIIDEVELAVGGAIAADELPEGQEIDLLEPDDMDDAPEQPPSPLLELHKVAEAFLQGYLDLNDAAFAKYKIVNPEESAIRQTFDKETRKAVLQFYLENERLPDIDDEADFERVRVIFNLKRLSELTAGQTSVLTRNRQTQLPADGTFANAEQQ